MKNVAHGANVVPGGGLTVNSSNSNRLVEVLAGNLGTNSYLIDGRFKTSGLSDWKG